MTMSPEKPAVSQESDADNSGPTAGRMRRFSQVLSPRKLSAVYLLVIFVIVFGILEPDTFLTDVTFSLVIRSGIVTCILGLAFMVPLLASQYDLSIGAVMSLSMGLTVWMSIHTGLSPWVSVVIAVLVSAVIGAISGVLVVYLNINSFIATLGMSQVLLGVTLLLSSNKQLVGEFR